MLGDKAKECLSNAPGKVNVSENAMEAGNRPVTDDGGNLELACGQKKGQGDCVPLPEAPRPLWGGAVLARWIDYFFAGGGAGAAAGGAISFFIGAASFFISPSFFAGAAFFAATILVAVPSE